MKRYYAYPAATEPKKIWSSEGLARGLTVFSILICLFLIVGNLAAQAIFDPKSIAERELAALAKDYYENYYYDILTASDLPNAEICETVEIYDEEGNWAGTEEQCANPIFSQYDDGGIQVYLRQLLLYNDGEHADSRQYFEGSYVCNANHTAAIIQPLAPYTRTDYSVTYEYDCEWAETETKTEAETETEAEDEAETTETEVETEVKTEAEAEAASETEIAPATETGAE